MPELNPERREQIRQDSRDTRARSQRVAGAAVTARRQSRRLSTLMANQDGGGLVGRIAFAALPVPAAVVDDSGRITKVNAAWKSFDELTEVLSLGADLHAGWHAVSDDGFVLDALAAVVRTGTPAQVEAAVNVPAPRRVLVQMGPAGAGEDRRVLVVLVDITEQYERERRALFEATHDPLTGVGNRAWLHRAVNEALFRLRRYGSAFALIYLDLDNFKPLNDRYGHAAGDVVLQAVATRWGQVVRAPDVLARVGGDEFVVVVHHADDVQSATALGARLTRTLDDPCSIDGSVVPVAVTVGIAFPPADTSAEGAIALADQAMYLQKREVGGRDPPEQAVPESEHAVPEA